LMVAQDGVILVRTVFADDQPTRAQVVAYRLKDGMLTRRESAATRDLTELDALWQATINNTDASQAVVLQAGVNAMTMRVWAKGESSWRATGANAAPSGSSGNTPTSAELTGLEVALQLNERPDRMVKVFLLGPV
jgi:general secretion pathway protein J